MTAHDPLAWAEADLVEFGHVLVDSEEDAFELLQRSSAGRTHALVEPHGDRWRVTIQSSKVPS